MHRDEFLLLLDQLFERPARTLTGVEPLEELQWDSMAVMSLIAMADKHCQVTLSPRQLAKCRTVDDVVQLVGVSG